LASKEALEAQAEALEAQKESAERQAARLESIPEDVPAAAIDQSRTSALGLSHQATAARAQAKASSAQVQAVTGQIGALSAQAEAAKAQVAAADAGVTRAQLLVDECTVHAPRDAEVAEIPVEVGELTQPGRTLIRLIDTQELFATFYLPNAEVGGVEPGAPAIVVADAWPDQTIEARVRTVALEAEFTPRNIQTRTDRDRLVYPVEVVFENPENKLRSGMPVQVTLPGTERQP
jgi:HlyD family secretion protein